MIGTPIAFALVIVGCLFAPGEHDALHVSCVVGLWLSAFSYDSPKIYHAKGKDKT